MSTGLGIAIAVISGVQGLFTAPMKLTSKSWQFEHSWIFFSLTLQTLCVIAAFATTDVVQIFRETPMKNHVLPVVLGMAWGFGMALFGTCAKLIGHGLTFSLVLGLSASLGSLVPLLALHQEKITQRVGVFDMIGVAIALFGIALTGCSGVRRENLEEKHRTNELNAPFNAYKPEDIEANESGHHQKATGRMFIFGLCLCVFAGVVSSMFNLALEFATPLAEKAAELGAEPAFQGNIMWLIIITCGGMMVNLVYSVFLLCKNGTWRTFAADGTSTMFCNIFLSILQGATFWGGNTLYGVALPMLGDLGPVIGFPISMSMNIIVANVFGACTGEWKFSDTRATVTGVLGNLIIIGAVAIIGAGAISDHSK